MRDSIVRQRRSPDGGYPKLDTQPACPLLTLQQASYDTNRKTRRRTEWSGKAVPRKRASNDANVSTSCLPDPTEHLAEPTGTFALGLSSESVILLVAGYNYGGTL